MLLSQIVDRPATMISKYLRTQGQKAYDKLMEDITHGGTCHWALPTLFHPGYMQVGGLLTVGTLIQFSCHFEQFYPLPTQS